MLALKEESAPDNNEVEMQDRLHLYMYRGIWRIYIQFTPKHYLLHLALCEDEY